MKKILRAGVIVAAAAGLSACALANPGGGAERASYNNRPLAAAAEPVTFGSLSYRAAERLVGSAEPMLPQRAPILITSMVDINKLDDSSTFGRIVSEQIGGRLVQLGYEVQEIRLRETLAIREGTGEVMLSRDLRRIGGQTDARAVVTGTYALGGEWIYVNARMVALDSGKVLSAVDFAVPLDRDTRRLVASR